MTGVRVPLLFGLWLAASAAAAQTPPGDGAAGADPTAQAREHFELGLQLMENENWEAALLEFSRSLEMHPTRSALFNAGMCQKALHRYVAALGTFRRWQVQYAESAPQEDREAVERAVAGVQAFVAQVEVSVSLAGAEILVDGNTAGVSPLSEPIVVEIGHHVVEARLGGYEAARDEVAVASRETARVAFDLVPTGGGPAPEGGPGPEEPAAGGIDSAWFWTTAGTAVALDIGGAVTGGMTVVSEDDFNDAVSRCRAGDDAACRDGYAIADDYDAWQLATNILLPAAGALAAAAVVLAFFTEFGDDESPPSEPPVVAVPVPTSGGMAIGLAVAW